MVQKLKMTLLSRLADWWRPRIEERTPFYQAEDALQFFPVFCHVQGHRAASGPGASAHSENAWPKSELQTQAPPDDPAGAPADRRGPWAGGQ
jgi:hypothetical protein